MLSPKYAFFEAKKKHLKLFEKPNKKNIVTITGG